jgi:dienelactone hydrolase
MRPQPGRNVPRWAAALILLALLAGRAPAGPDRPAAQPGPVADTYPSGGKQVRVERFDPAGRGPHPAVVLLPGIDGLAKASGLFRGVAHSLAEQGFVVVLPFYHDRTGTNPKQVDGLLRQFQGCLANPGARGKAWRQNRRLFREWEEAACDAVAHARGQKHVDPDRVVLVGYSLGGFLASAVAAQPDQEIAALVVLSGGITRDTAARVGAGGLPPTFLIHGKLDAVVPVAEARRLARLLEERGVPWDDWVHPMLGHGFLPRGGVVPDRKAMEDAQRQALAFVRKHLGRGEKEAAGRSE